MPLAVGQIVNGKYKVLRALGDGGMGSVYEARHEVLGTRVALKLLHPEFSRTGIAKRFLQEARASARIRSPHVVGVADADQTADGQAFIVLEYIEGKTLRELYASLALEHRSLTYEEALEFAMQMFEGVEAAHAAGIVHRDLKPDNVMITEDAKGLPLLKLLDFGIAKVDEPPESAGPALTRPGALLGTPEYMAPEQVYSAGSADVRSDVFALGVILFEMLSGRRPVLSDDPQQIAVSYLTGAFTRLDEVCPDAPPALAVAVHRAFAAQPRDRFASVAEMRAAIEPYAPLRPTSTVRASMLSPAFSIAGGSSKGTRPIPDTRKYPVSGSNPPPAPSRPAPSGSVPPPPGPGSSNASNPAYAAYPSNGGSLNPFGTTEMPGVSGTTPAGTHLMPSRGSSGGAPVTPPATAFLPDYPSAIAPSGALPAVGPSDSASQINAPMDRISIVEPSSRLPYGPTPVPSVAPPAKPNRTILIVVIAVVVLLLGAATTLGILSYQGWFDDDEEPTPKPHKTTPRPGHVRPVQPPAKGGALR